MKAILSAILCGLSAFSAFAAVSTNVYPVPPPTFEAKDFTQWSLKRAGKSRRADISVSFTAEDGSDDYINIFRLDLQGNAYDRGYGQGFLLAKEIVEFTGPKLDKFYMDEVLGLDISKFPEPLQAILKVIQVKGAKAAPDAFKAAMAWVWEKEKKYVPSYYFDEIDGMANGICDSLRSTGCNATEWANRIQQLNMLPELIRMACTAYGAWGTATPNGGLVQLRALDFGSGPWVNYTVVSVHRNLDAGYPFVSVSFPGFVGAITGVSEVGIGISEKVWMTYDTPDLQPGSYDGEADVLVLRDILQFSKNRAEAAEYVQKIARTWAIWIGVGDYETQKLDLIGYTQADAGVYNDQTMPAMTGQPFIQDVCYVDKHPQPSHDGATGSLPTSLQDFHGNITLETSKIITKYHQTGDVHIATYDFTAKEMYVAIGRINHEGTYLPPGSSDNSAWKAYNRPFVKFNLKDLWKGL